MKTKNLASLTHFAKAPVTIFQGVVGSGKSNAIMQTIATNPEAVAVLLNGELWSDYIRETDTIIRVDDSNLAAQLSAPLSTEGSRIFMDVASTYEDAIFVIVGMVKENPDREYIFILNNTPDNNLVSMESLKELTLKNSRIFIETQCSPDIDRDVLRTMDRVLFKTLNANVKLLHSNSPIEKERATLDCGEALYISEGAETCKICFSKV